MLLILNGLNCIVNQNLIDQFNKKLTSELSISSYYIFIVKTLMLLSWKLRKDDRTKRRIMGPFSVTIVTFILR